jgi:recombination protein RecA
LKFYSTIRVDVRRIASIKDGDEVVGSRTKVKIVKNKVAPPFREAEFDIMYGEGISREGELLDLAVDKNVVDKSGAWFSFHGERLGQGRENARQFLKDNHDHRGRIELALREIMGLSIPTVPSAAAATAASENGKRR